MMKKYLPILGIILLAGCNQAQNKQTTSVPTNQQIQQDLDKKLNKITTTIEKSNLPQEIKQKIIEEQKKNYQILKSLTGDSKKKYVLENYILPEIIKSKEVSTKCTTTNLNNYLNCLYLTKTPIDKLTKLLPSDYKNFVEFKYYYTVYSNNKQGLFQKTTNPQAIKAKKEKIYQLYLQGIIKNPKICNKFPEKEVQTYCKSLFK